MATTTYNGLLYVTASANGATMALARQLVAAGCPDQPWEARNAEGQRTVYGSSLHALARTTISKDGRFVRWQPRPDITYAEDAQVDAGSMTTHGAGWSESPSRRVPRPFRTRAFLQVTISPFPGEIGKIGD
jgi:hypothetical protein